MVVFGSLEILEHAIWNSILAEMDMDQYQNSKVVIKGCSKYDIPVYAFAELARRLRPVASSIMFGEPCSTVPLYKKSS